MGKVGGDGCNLTYLTYTSVMFCADDTFGKLVALCSILPQVEFLCLCSAAVFTKDTLKVHFWRVILCLLAGEGVNMVLKTLIAQERPSTAFDSYGHYGMPSSHAQFQSTFAVGVGSFLREERKRLSLRRCFCTLSYTFLFLSVVAVSVSRVYYPHHTAMQVAFGILTGLLIGANFHTDIVREMASKIPCIMDSAGKAFVFEA